MKIPAQGFVEGWWDWSAQQRQRARARPGLAGNSVRTQTLTSPADFLMESFAIRTEEYQQCEQPLYH